MRSYLDCIPCFFNQALRAGRMANLPDEEIIEILYRLGDNLRSIKLSDSPPKTGKFVYSLVNEISDIDDPYKDVKKQQNETAMSLLSELLEYVNSSKNKLDAALRVSSIGNIIDLGAPNIGVNLEEFLHKALNIEHKLWDFKKFSEKIESAKSLLILGDNAGEIVFDKVLLKTTKEIFPEIEITYAVRDAPVINDATAEDAISVGIDEFARILSTGSDAPGILMDEVSKKFKLEFEKSDIIISKGQGNYETLDDVSRDIFFVLTVKCDVVSRHLNLPIGASVLYYKNSR